MQCKLNDLICPINLLTGSIVMVYCWKRATSSDHDNVMHRIWVVLTKTIAHK